MDSQPDQKDPLQELLVDDAKSVDRSHLAAFLKPYVGFDKETREPHFHADFNTIISNEAKIDVILLASKARALIFDEPEGLTPIEIIKMEVMPSGSVKSSIKKLNDSRKIKKDSAGKYSIPNYRIDNIIDRLRK